MNADTREGGISALPSFWFAWRFHLGFNVSATAPFKEIPMLEKLFEKAEHDGRALIADELAILLDLERLEDIESLFAAAYRVKAREVGRKVYFRGLIEFSNICRKNCLYCGIRRDNKNLERYRMAREEIVEAARWAWENRYGSVVLQSGEMQSNDFTDFVEEVLQAIRHQTNGELSVTLSLGEQDDDTLRRWRTAGAHRYLLRIETANEALYKSLHPEDHSFTERKACLKKIAACGYQVGSGVMMGLPGQTVGHLVDDLLFLRDMDVDMIGMGPYIPHRDTPMAQSFPVWDEAAKHRQLHLGLKMLAVARLFLRDVNLAATTALQALDPQGREKGLLAGANVIMPNVTDTRYRAAYQLYSDKPCLDENAGMCRSCLGRRIASVGEEIGFAEPGDAPHWKKRVKE
jgi:biotin synthase